MLDSFLKVACGRAQKAEEQVQLVETMRKLPEELLLKIASGEEKLSYIGSCGDLGGGGSWLDKFKGTPLLAQAIELEKQDLQEQMAEQSRYREEDQARSARNAARDQLSVERKLLELQLAEHGEGAGAEPQAFAGQETPEEEALEHGAESPEAQAAAQQPAAPAAVPAAPKEEPAEKAAMKLAFAKMKMASLKGRGHVRSDIDTAVNRYDIEPEEAEAMAPHVQEHLTGQHGQLQEQAQYAEEHPVLNKMKGAVPGALIGAIPGALAGGHVGGGKGALVGGALGALGGGGLGAMVTPNAEQRTETADAYSGAMGAMDVPQQVMLAAKRKQVEDQREHELYSAELAGGPSVRYNYNYNRNRDLAPTRKEAMILVPGDVGAMVGYHRSPEGERGRGMLRGALGEVGGAFGGAALAGLPLALMDNPAAKPAAFLGALGGAAYGIKRMTDPRQPAAAPATAQAPLQQQQDEVEQKTAARLVKTAIGLGMLGKTIANGASSVGKGLAGVGKGMTAAYQTSRAFGGTVPQAAGMAASSLGNAAKGFATAKPLQAAALAGGAGLVAGHALSHGQQQQQ
jgi:hypothetical protein